MNSGTAENLNSVNSGEPVGVNLIRSEIPQSFKLEQNYPNPFNPLTVSDLKLYLHQITGLRLIIFCNKEDLFKLNNSEIRMLMTHILNIIPPHRTG